MLFFIQKNKKDYLFTFLGYLALALYTCKMNKLFFLFTLFISNYSFAILTTNPDSIRGALRPERLCFDVSSYDLRINIDPIKKRISGQNDIYFTQNGHFVILRENSCYFVSCSAHIATVIFFSA